ncbi:MAG: YdhR family protein [Dehalococcoidia bacterium]
MSAKLLQLNLKFSVSPEEYTQAVGPLASELAKVPGHCWTIWLMNEKDQEAGGIYLFEDEESLKGFLEGPIVANVMSYPVLSDFTVKSFNVIEEQTAITQGPV